MVFDASVILTLGVGSTNWHKFSQLHKRMKEQHTWDKNDEILTALAVQKQEGGWFLLWLTGKIKNSGKVHCTGSTGMHKNFVAHKNVKKWN